MKLVDVYSKHAAPLVLFNLLAERTPEQSISHKRMPSVAEHLEFVGSRPYLAWYLIEVENESVGACYLSKQREIGVAIFQRHAGHSYGTQAVQLLMQTHPGRFLANVAPQNLPSHHLFQKLGFQPLQITYELETE